MYVLKFAWFPWLGRGGTLIGVAHNIKPPPLWLRYHTKRIIEMNCISHITPKTRWTVGHQLIIQSDCLSELRSMRDESIDVVATSPPYNIGVNYQSHDDNQPFHIYFNWLHDVGSEIQRVLKNNGSFFLNVGNTSTNQWIGFDAVFAFRNEYGYSEPHCVG
jgi:hypothetical protein